DSLEEAVQMAKENLLRPDSESVSQLIGKYLFHRYSFFSGDDDIREFKARKAHGYKNIRVSRCVLDGVAKGGEWQRNVRRFDKYSYGFSQLNLAGPQIDDSKISRPSVATRTTSAEISVQRAGTAALMARESKRKRLIRKLQRDPHGYFRDSRHFFLRPLSLFFPQRE